LFIFVLFPMLPVLLNGSYLIAPLGFLTRI
jgi:hypothetical protein